MPKDDFITTIVTDFKKHFKFIEQFTTAVQGVQSLFFDGTAPSLTVDLKDKGGVVKFLDLSFYAPYKATGDIIITSFIYVMFVWRVFKNLPSIISGASIVTDRVERGSNK